MNYSGNTNVSLLNCVYFHFLNLLPLLFLLYNDLLIYLSTYEHLIVMYNNSTMVLNLPSIDEKGLEGAASPTIGTLSSLQPFFFSSESTLIASSTFFVSSSERKDELEEDGVSAIAYAHVVTSQFLNSAHHRFIDFFFFRTQI